MTIAFLRLNVSLDYAKKLALIFSFISTSLNNKLTIYFVSSTTKMNPVQKQTTVKFVWKIVYEQLRLNGSLKSDNFGTDSTKFYWIAELKATYFSLYLYLAGCNKDKLQIDCSVDSTAISQGFESVPNLPRHAIKGGTFLIKEEVNYMFNCFLKFFH